MKRSFLKTGFCLIAVAGLFCFPRQASVQAQHTISTRAGLINRIRGQVFIQHAQSENRDPVTPDLQMTDGDRLATGFMSRAEILVNSAAYLRLDEWSEVRAVTTRLTEARFELVSGTFLIQAGNPGMMGPMGIRGSRGFPIGRQNPASKMDAAKAFELATPHGILTIGKDGLFQISVEPAATQIDIFEGEVVLGARSEARGNSARKVKGTTRVRLTGNPLIKPLITKLKLKPYDEFDRWHFPIADHGLAMRVEGEATAAWDSGRNQHRVAPEFQVREGQVLTTQTASYLELRISVATSLCLDQSTQIRAIKGNTGEAGFELTQGVIIVNSAATYPMRPVRIITPRGAFSIKRGSLVRFEINAAAVSVLVRRGEVGGATNVIGAGKLAFLTNGAPPREEAVADKNGGLDSFDRWSMGLLRAGTITRHEGPATVERQGGARVDLEKNPTELQVQLLEGAHLTTAQGGRVALDAGPTSIHANENTELVAVSSSGQEREFEVLRGTALVYVDSAAALYSRTRLKVSTPHGLAEISGSGIFRFDVSPSGTTIRARSGSLLIRTRETPPAKAAVKLREKQTAFLKAGASAPQISSTPDTPDDFDQWSVGTRQFPFQRMSRSRRSALSAGPSRNY